MNFPEHHIFNALTKTCLIESRETSNYHRCGRTDKGVSAFSQVISIEVRSKFPVLSQQDSDSISNELNYCQLLNRVLPLDIRFIAWLPLKNAQFSSRFDCISRTYRYFFPKGSLNIRKMEEAIKHLIGVHDFRNLCKMDVANGVTSFIRSIETAEIIKPESEEISPFSMLIFQITGKAFLWHQIRCIMAILLLIGQGNEEPSVIKELLDVEKNPRKPQYSLASDLPLNLYDVKYRDFSLEGGSGDAIEDKEPVVKEDLTWIYNHESLTKVISDLQKQWSVEAVKKEMMATMIQDLTEELQEGVTVQNQADDLIQGTKTKKYIRLMTRDLCPSLERKIEHYVKKKRLE